MSRKPTITVDLKAVEKRFSGSELKAKQAAFAHRVGFDMNKRCPEDEGTLRDSMPIASDFENGLVIWDTPYAKDVLNRDSVSKEKNPNATPHWPEAVKAERIEDWRTMAAKLIEGGSAEIGGES